jgi:hypothetical protein
MVHRGLAIQQPTPLHRLVHSLTGDDDGLACAALSNGEVGLAPLPEGHRELGCEKRLVAYFLELPYTKDFKSCETAISSPLLWLLLSLEWKEIP